jgi:hypothetical protein
VKIVARAPGRTADEERIEIATDDGAPAGRGLWFSGRPEQGLKPWADLVVDDTSILSEVADALGPGASLMVAYGGDETERALRRRLPPEATPLGLELLRAGCRWFKDWYYPEGGREGGTKLQGTLPLDEGRRASSERALVAQLHAYLGRGDVAENDRRLVEQALDVLERRVGV